MRSKPDLTQFIVPKDPSAFLESGAADLADRVQPRGRRKKEVVLQQQRDQKVFRLSVDICQALKNEAYRRSIESGKRVTENELVEQALRRLLKL